jgi:mercuric ion transport protein
MNDQALIRTGTIGAIIAAVCCATPVLAILLGAVGLSALSGYLDYMLLPALALCLALIGYGVYRRRMTESATPNKTTRGT